MAPQSKLLLEFKKTITWYIASTFQKATCQPTGQIHYSRLLGKGRHNIYQPTDEELIKIDKKAARNTFQKR